MRIGDDAGVVAGLVKYLGLFRTSQASVSIAASGPPFHQHIHWSMSAWVLASPPQSARSGRLAARYLRIAGDSPSTKASSSSVGTRPLGFWQDTPACGSRRYEVRA